MMEKKFKKAFINYTKYKKANKKLQKLKMKDGNINIYITHFF